MPGSTKCKDDAARSRGGHCEYDPAPPSDAQGDLVTRNRSRHRDQIDHCCDCRRMPWKARTGMKARGVSQEGNHPAARAEKLEAVRGVAKGVARARAVGEHPAPGRDRKQRSQGKRLRLDPEGRTEREKCDQTGGEPAHGRKKKCAAPAIKPR